MGRKRRIANGGNFAAGDARDASSVMKQQKADRSAPSRDSYCETPSGAGKSYEERQQRRTAHCICLSKDDALAHDMNHVLLLCRLSVLCVAGNLLLVNSKITCSTQGAGGS